MLKFSSNVNECKPQPEGFQHREQGEVGPSPTGRSHVALVPNGQPFGRAWEKYSTTSVPHQCHIGAMPLPRHHSVTASSLPLLPHYCHITTSIATSLPRHCHARPDAASTRRSEVALVSNGQLFGRAWQSLPTTSSVEPLFLEVNGIP